MQTYHLPSCCELESARLVLVQACLGVQGRSLVHQNVGPADLKLTGEHVQLHLDAAHTLLAVVCEVEWVEWVGVGGEGGCGWGG